MYCSYLKYYNLSPFTGRLMILHRVMDYFKFISEFYLYLKSLVYANGHLIIVGHLNINVGNHDDDDAKKFLDLLYSLRLTQLVTYPTHYTDHILDLIITRAEDACVTGIVCDWPLPPDHCSIYFNTIFTRPRYERVVRSSRKRPHTNINVFASMMGSVLPDKDLLGSDV